MGWLGRICRFYCTGIHAERLRKTTKNLTCYSSWPILDSNEVPPDCQSRMFVRHTRARSATVAECCPKPDWLVFQSPVQANFSQSSLHRWKLLYCFTVLYFAWGRYLWILCCAGRLSWHRNEWRAWRRVGSEGFLPECGRKHSAVLRSCVHLLVILHAVTHQQWRHWRETRTVRVRPSFKPCCHLPTLPTSVWRIDRSRFLFFSFLDTAFSRTVCVQTDSFEWSNDCGRWLGNGVERSCHGPLLWACIILALPWWDRPRAESRTGNSWLRNTCWPQYHALRLANNPLK
jgi:hypothetical protein